MEDNLTIRVLEPGDAAALSALLCSQPPGYAQFFTPFAFDEAAVAAVIGEQRRDLLMGMYWAEALIGFFMLRGWDAGYDVPSYGILIDKEFRGYGLELVSLDLSKIICKLRGARRLMLKMHPENFSARGVARKSGFVQTSIEARTGNVIYHLDL